MKKLLSLTIASAIMTATLPVTMAAEETATDKTVVFVQEDWNYDLTGLADKKLITYQTAYGSIDGGFGWDGGWMANDACTTTMTAGTGHGYVEFDQTAVGSNPTGGFHSNRTPIYRKLNAPIALSEANEFYITWANFFQGVQDEGEVGGISLMGKDIKIGAARYTVTNADETTTTESRIAIKTPDDVIKTGDTVIKHTGNTSYTYVAKVTINPDGVDSISLNAYLKGAGKEEYPTEWQITAEYDLDNEDFIDVFGYYANGGPNIYYTPVSFYKKQSAMTKTDVENFIDSTLNALPEKDKMTASTVSEYADAISEMEELAGIYDIDINAFDTDGKYAAFYKKVADAKEISVPVDIRADMKVNAYNAPFNETVKDSNAQIINGSADGNIGWNTDEIKALDGWRYDWADVTDNYNYLQLDGIEYGMLVKRGYANIDGQMLATAFAGDKLYYEYDIDNGYYSKVNALASVPNPYYYNYCKNSNKGKLAVMLVYENGETEIVMQNVYSAQADKSAERAQLTGKLYKKDSTAAPNVTTGYAHVYEFKADNTKKLDKVRVLGSYADVTADGTAINMNNDTKDGLYWGYYSTSTDVGDGTEWKSSYVNDAGETVETYTLGEYLQTKYLGKPVYGSDGKTLSSSYKTYGHVFYANVLALTAVTNIANRKADILDIVNAWPENPTSQDANNNKATLENIENSLAEFEKSGAAVTEVTENAKFKAMKKAITMLKEVPVFVDISENFNVNVYADTPAREAGAKQNPRATEGPNCGLRLSDAYAWTNWKYDWNKSTDNFNVLKLGDTEFNLKLAVGNADNKAYNTAWMIQKNEEQTKTFDVEDGYYTGFSVLAHVHSRWHSGYKNHYIGVYFVYEDGEELQVQQVFDSSANKEGVLDQVVARKTGAHNTLGWADYEDSVKLYAHKYDFTVDSTRVLKEIKVVNNSYSDYDAETNTITPQETTTGNTKYFLSNIFAMSLKEFLSDYTVKVKREVEPLIAALPENLTSADTDAVNEIKAIVDVAVGYGVDTADIEGYEDLEKRLYDFVEIKDIEKNVDFDEITIDVELNKSTKSEYFTKENIKLLKDGEETAEAYTLTVNDEKDGLASSFTVTVKNAVAKENYSVKMSIGYLEYNYRFMTGSPMTVKAEAIGSDESKLVTLESMAGDLININVTVDSEVESDYTAITALYDGEGRLQSICDIRTADAIVGENSYAVEYIELPEDVKADWYYKVMVVDSLEGMKPLAVNYESFTAGKTYGYDNVIDTTKDLNVVYFGDSQTEGQKFSTAFTALLEENRTGKVNATVSGLGGTSSMNNIWRVQKDVLAYEPDIVFVEFAPNDTKFLTSWEMKQKEILASSEGIVRTVLSAKHEPVVIMWNPMTRDNEDIEKRLDELINEIYSQVVEAYGISYIDFNAYADSMAETDDKYKHENLVGSDNVHFTDDGGKLCAEYVYSFMDDEDYVKKASFSADIVSEHEYVNPDYVSALEGAYDANWADVTVDTNLEGYGTATNAYPHYMQTTKNGASMTFTFTGTSIGFYNLISQNGATYSYVIDGNISGTGKMTSTTSYRYKSMSVLKTDLEPGEHTITITHTGEDGTELGLAYFAVDEQ